MRRDVAKARDYARRHGVPKVHERAEDLIRDPDIDAVYVATLPATHCELALAVAAAGKPCLVEKPMALNHAECLRMTEAFKAREVPLWVAYYRRALPRFLLVRDLLSSGTIGRVTSVHVEVTASLPAGDKASGWRFDPAVAGAGPVLRPRLPLFRSARLPPRSDHRSLAAWPRIPAESTPRRTSRPPRSRSAVAVLGTGVWNFNAYRTFDRMTFKGSAGELQTPVFGDTDVVVTRGSAEGDPDVHAVRNPPHVHQPLIQAIVDELRGGAPRRRQVKAPRGRRGSWTGAWRTTTPTSAVSPRRYRRAASSTDFPQNLESRVGSRYAAVDRLLQDHFLDLVH